MNTTMTTQILGGFPGVLLIIVYIAFIIFWMVVFWRFMRAHEQLADAHDEIRQAVRAWFKSKNNP